MRDNVHNFLTNFGGPVNMANDLLEAEFVNAGEAGARFIINTTIGVGGLADRGSGIRCPQPQFFEQGRKRGMPFGLVAGQVNLFRGKITQHEIDQHDGQLTVSRSDLGCDVALQILVQNVQHAFGYVRHER